MMAYYNFARLIQKYSSTFTLVSTSEGSYNDMGDYVPGETTEQELTGAIMDISESKLYRSEGTLTAKDKVLYMFNEVQNLVGSHIAYNGNKYRVEKELENAKFTDVYEYTLKYVSAFN